MSLVNLQSGVTCHHKGISLSMAGISCHPFQSDVSILLSKRFLRECSMRRQVSYARWLPVLSSYSSCGLVSGDRKNGWRNNSGFGLRPMSTGWWCLQVSGAMREFLLVPLCHVYLGLELSHDINVACRDTSCERGYDDLNAMVLIIRPWTSLTSVSGSVSPSHILLITFL